MLKWYILASEAGRLRPGPQSRMVQRRIGVAIYGGLGRCYVGRISTRAINGCIPASWTKVPVRGDRSSSGDGTTASCCALERRAIAALGYATLTTCDVTN